MAYQRMLVPVDGSPTSTRALEEAIRLAREQHARIRIIHVLETRPMYLPDGALPIVEMEQALRKEGEWILAQAAAAAQKQDVPVETALLDDVNASIATQVNADSRQWGADLVVLGSHGRHGLDRLLLGSVAERVARTVTVPVLMIHGQ